MKEALFELDQQNIILEYHQLTVTLKYIHQNHHIVLNYNMWSGLETF